MKTKLALLLITCLTVNSLACAQCNPFFTYKEGDKWEITNYNGKGKVEGRQVSEVKSLSESAGGWEAAVNFTLFDKKDKVVYDKEVGMKCDGGTVFMDMSQFLPDEQLEAFKDMNMRVDMDHIEIPSNLKPGMTLDDGSVTISGDIPLRITVNITNRKVEGKESLTTPAGTFECYKITYDVGTKTVVNVQGKGTDWIAEEVGVVKTESYNKSGKLIGYSQLTKVN